MDDYPEDFVYCLVERGINTEITEEDAKLLSPSRIFYQKHCKYCVAWREEGHWRSITSGYSIQLSNVIKWKKIELIDG